MTGLSLAATYILATVIFLNCWGCSPPLPPLPPRSPYYHKIYQATSSNGISWQVNKTMLLNHASVPGVVRYKSKIYLYYVNASNPFEEKLSVVISADEGQTFTANDVTISGSNSPYPVDPSPLVDGNKIRLTYLGNFNQGQTHKIVTATSSDGINFSEEAVIFNQESYTDPDLFQAAQGNWVLFVSDGTSLIKATHPNASGTFTKDNSFSFTNGSISSTFLVNGKYYTYYAESGGISVAQYSNGSLSNLASNIITGFDGMIADPTVASLESGSYIMYFKQAPAQ